MQDTAKGQSSKRGLLDMIPPQRPETYDAEVCCRVARVLCERGGTEADLAKAFNEELRTIMRWLIEHEEFFEACKAGHAVFAARISSAIQEQALGANRSRTRLTHSNGAPVLVTWAERGPVNINAALYLLNNGRSSEEEAAAKTEAAMKALRDGERRIDPVPDFRGGTK